MTADVWVHVAEAVRGKLLLSSEPSHSVGEYNAMDIARGFAARAENTLLDRCLPPQTDCGSMCCDPSRELRITTESRMLLMSIIFANACRHVFNLSHRKAPIRLVTWIGLLVLCCELRQALKHADIGPSGVAKALQLPAQRRQRVVLTVLQELHDKKISSTICFLVVILLELLREN